ncbi:MAG: hypothetical protein ABIE03_07915 [Patescibacteria group bacterium]|nr:hypothetical protein [Patescibacteria group bacterium]
MKNPATIDIPFPLFLVIIVVIFSIVFFLTAAMVHLSKKVRILTKIRYGFGGKPIFSMLVFLFIVLSIPLTLFASSKSINMIQKASAQKDILVEIQDVGKLNEDHFVSFMTVPYVDETAWAGKTYTVSWEIRGEIDYEKMEKDVNQSNPSYFKKLLPNGKYRVKVVVESDNFRVQRFEDFVLE